MATGQDPRRPKVMRVATRCRTVDELIAAFATLVDEQSLVVLTDQQRVIGSRQPFVVELADGQMVMKGEAEVVESTAPPKGRLRLKFLSLDGTGREVHKRMLARKRGMATGQSPGNGKPRNPTEPGLKPLVRIPEPVVKKEASEPKAASAPPAPFARPAPVVPRQPTPVSPLPVIPPKSGAATPATMPRKAQLTPPPGAVPTVPSIPSVRRATPTTGTMQLPAMVKPPMATPTPAPTPAPVPEPSVVVAPEPAPPPNDIARGPGPILKANDLPDFDELPDLDGDTSVDKNIPLPPGVAFKLPMDRPKTSQPEEGDRTPGSPYVLPANPFGDVAPESLEAFVECMVYEETGQFQLGENPSLDALAEPMFEPTPPPSMSPPSPTATPTPVPARALTPTQPPPMMLHSQQPPPSLPDWARPQATPLPQPYPTTLPLAAPREADPLDLELQQQRHRKRLGMILGGIAVFGVLVGVIASQCGGGGGDSARAGAGTTAIDAGVTAKKAISPPDAAAAAVADPVPDPDPVPVPVPVPDPIIPPGDCEVHVTSNPPGATVTYAGRSIGETPLRSAVPCGSGKLTISYRRYATVEKPIAPQDGEPASVSVRLERPEQKVTIRSRPTGATITVDGKTLGKTPLSATVRGFTSIKVKAELTGHAPWSQKVYVKKTSSTITATLKPVKKPKRKK